MPDDSRVIRMPTPEEAAAELLRRDRLVHNFHDFIKEAWPIIEGGRPFYDNWHLGAIAEHLDACVIHNQIKNLLINQPPRSMKSTTISIALVAYAWIRLPSLQFLYTSYSHPLSIRDGVRCRRLIESQWYQVRFGDKFQLSGDQNTKLRFDNNRGGHRIASSVDGTNTGEGGDCLIADDPNSAKDTSKTVLESTNEWWDQVMSTRINDQRTGHKIVVQQRLHEQDLTGHILSKSDENFVHLMIPMEFEKKRACVTVVLPSTNGKPWRDPRTEEGELLWPARWGAKEVDDIKRDLSSSYAVAGQLQQRPAPESGGIMKKDWFRWWKHPIPPKMSFVLQSWDTALTAQELNAYSACTTWGVFEDDTKTPNVMLLHAARWRLEYPELRKTAQQMALDYRDDDWQRPMPKPATYRYHYKPDVILVEAKANGLSLIQDLGRAGIIATKFNPDRHGDKIQRVKLVTHIIEAGRVWVAAAPPAYTELRRTAELLVGQCILFPNAMSRDMVDTMTQALIRLQVSGWVRSPNDPQEYSEPDIGMKEAIY